MSDEKALVDADKMLVEADTTAERVIAMTPPGFHPLGEQDDVDVWAAKLAVYLTTTEVQAVATRLAIAKRLVSADVRRSLGEWAQVKDKVADLVKRRTVPDYTEALKIVLAKDVSLFDLCGAAHKDIASVGSKVDLIAKVMRHSKAIIDGAKNLVAAKEDQGKKQLELSLIMQGLSQNEARRFRESAKTLDLAGFQAWVDVEEQRRRADAAVRDFKPAGGPNPSPQKKSAGAPTPSSPKPKQSDAPPKPSGGRTPRAATAAENTCPICKQKGHYAETCEQRRADRSSRSGKSSGDKPPEKREGSTAQLESPGFYVPISLATKGGSALHPAFLDTGSIGNLIDAQFAQKIELSLRDADELILRGIGEQTSRQVADISFTLHRKLRKEPFRVCKLPEGVDVILGGSFLQRNKIDILSSEERLRLTDEEGAKVSYRFKSPTDSPREMLLALLVAHSPAEELAHPEDLFDFLPAFDAKGIANNILADGLCLLAEGDRHPTASPNQPTAVATPTDAPDTPPVININDINVWPGATSPEREKIVSWVQANADMFFNENARDALGRMQGFMHSMPMDKVVEDNPPPLDGAQHLSPKKLSVGLLWLREGLARGRCGVHHGRVVFLNRLVIVETINPSTGKSKYRICLDLRKVNEHLKKLPYPQKRVRDVLARLKGAQRASELDNRWSYEQVPLREADWAKVCFWLDGRVYSMRVMVFGDKNAPFMMQYIMDVLLHDERDVADTLIDNTLAFTASTSVDEHLAALTRLTKHLRAHNVKWGLPKCKFFYPDIETLGHVVSGEGTLPSPSRVNAWRNMAPPRTAEDLLSFLQSINFWREYIPAFAEFDSPLRALAAKEPFLWTDSAIALFKELLLRASSPPLLVHPDMDKEFYCRTDASGVAIAGVLFQPHPTKSGKGNVLLPIAFYSRALTKHEVNYATTSLELLAAKDTLERTRLIHEGCPALHLETDHVALVYMAKNPILGNHRSARHILVVRQYATDVIHRRGKSPEMRLPDVMSRDPNYMLSADRLALVTQPIAYAKLAPFDALPREQQKDPVTASLITAISSRNPAILPAAEALRQRFLDSLQVVDGVLYHVDPARGTAKRNGRFWVPESLRPSLRDALHADGHFKSDKLYRKAAALYFFPDMYAYMAGKIDCLECSRMDAPTQHLTGHLRARQVGYPRKLVAFDHLSIGDVELFTVVDVFTFWCWAFVVPTKSIEDTVRALLDISLEDAPRAWTCDNYSTFTSEVMKALAKTLDIDIHYIPDGWPQMNPSERLNRYLVEIITKECMGKPELIQARLPFILAGIRTTPMEALGGLSPFMLETGRQPRTVLDARLGIEPADDRTRELYGHDVLASVADGIEIAKRAREHVKRREQRQLDKRQVTETFKLNDLVMVRQERDKANVAPRYLGPFPIVELVGTNEFIIETPGGKDKKHMKDLRRYDGSVQVLSAALRATHARSLDHHSDDWIDAGQTAKSKLDASTLVGRRIRVWWPSLGRDRDGLVTGLEGNRHVVLYFEELDSGEDPEFLEYLVDYSAQRLARWQLLQPRQAAQGVGV